jgi:hypothetical protein
MTISGYVTQTPVEILVKPSDTKDYLSQIVGEVLVQPEYESVSEYFSQVVAEILVLSFYTENPTLGNNVNYYAGDETDDKNPNKVHPGGHVGGSKGSVITLLAFENVNVPQGAVIRDAYVTFTASDSDSSSTVNANIVALDEDNPEIPDTYAELILEPTTTAYALWDDIGAWVAENEYSSVSITYVIQEIIDRVGWELGNTIIILFEDSSSTPNSHRKAYSKLTAGKEPTLTILWDYLETSLDAPVLDPISNPLNQSFYTVSWNTVAGATSYELWEQKNEDDWSAIYTGALLSQDLTDKSGAIWSYRVRATDGSTYSDFSNVESTQVNATLTSTFRISLSI